MRRSQGNSISARTFTHSHTLVAAWILLLFFSFLTALVHFRFLAGIDLAFAQAVFFGLDVEFFTACATVTGVLMASQMALLYSLVGSLLLWRRGAGPWSLAPMAFLIGITIELVMKLLVNQPLEPLREFHRGTFYPFFGMSLNGTYPSGHALRTAFFFCFLALLLWYGGGIARRLVALGLIPLIFFFGFTRLYIGDHWLSDVVGGLLLGAAIALVAAPPMVRRLARNVPDVSANRSRC